MESLQHFRVALASGTALVSIVMANAAVAADGFGITGQSAYFDGMANAGSAAGVDISSVYWNPAATAAKPGLNTSSNFTAAFIDVPLHANGGVEAFLFPLARDTDVGRTGFPLSFFTTYQLSDRIYAGLNVSAPFGLVTKPDNIFWAGSPLATTSRIFSYDINPTLAYKLTPTLTIGAGIQFLQVYTKLNHSADGIVIPAPTQFRSNDWGLGGTVGILWQPTPATSLGIGYRSRIDLDLSGTYLGLAPLRAAVIPSRGASASFPLPDQVTISARQQVTARWAVLGTVEWQNWSRLDDVTAADAIGPLNTTHFNYQDRWSVSVGAEFAYSPSIMLRAGVGYDRSPVTDFVRDIAVPDTDDVRVAIGASYRWSDRLTVDLSYTHYFFDDAPFCIAAPNLISPTTHCTGLNTVLLQGDANPGLDAVALGVKYRWSEEPVIEPLK